MCAAIVLLLKESPVAGSAPTVLDLAVPTRVPTRAQRGLFVARMGQLSIMLSACRTIDVPHLIVNGSKKLELIQGSKQKS